MNKRIYTLVVETEELDLLRMKVLLNNKPSQILCVMLGDKSEYYQKIEELLAYIYNNPDCLEEEHYKKIKDLLVSSGYWSNDE